MTESDVNPDELYPRTVEAAVSLVLSKMSDESKDWLREFKGTELQLVVKLAIGFAPGMSVRALLGLWGENPELLSQMPPHCRHPDCASTHIIVECWRQLRSGGRHQSRGKKRK